MTSDNTTRMKVLLAPAWDHNFPHGPARWLSHDSPATTAIEDNYYTTNVTNNEFKEPWWPGETNVWDPAQRFCWDADTRAVESGTFASGGPLNRYAFGTGSGRSLSGNITTEIEETKNRLRGTGNPISSWNKSDTTFVDTTNFLEAASGYTAVGAYPNHFQDAVHDAILQGSDPSDATTSNKLIFPNKPGSLASQAGGPNYGVWQSTTGHQFSGHYSEGASSGIGPGVYSRSGAGSGYFEGQPETYTYGYEFTLNVESITHTWTTLTSVLPLPGLLAGIASNSPDAAQLVALAIDMGAMREQITVKGKIYDGPNDPYAASWEKTIRKQQLLDIVRSQWGAMTTPEVTGNSSGKTMMQPNRFPALTIGPMHTLNPNGDQGKTFKEKPRANEDGNIKKTEPAGSGFYTNPQQNEFHIKSLDMWRYGEEPSDDVRGTPFLVNDAEAKYVFQVWDYKFGYSGRRRYRGLITRCSLNISGGSPDVWDFSFDFAVVKNETTYRRKGLMTEPPEQEEGP